MKTEEKCYGIYNKKKKEFQFGIQEPSKKKARQKLFDKIGDDARKPRFEIREIKQLQTKKENANMTEQEAMQVIQKAYEQSDAAIRKMLAIKDEAKKRKQYGEYYSILDNCLKEKEACIVTIQAIKDVMQYRALEERLKGISVEQVVNGFISAVEKDTCEEY